MTQPTIYMIAGPNGAGKTTLAYEALQKFFEVNEFVNADEIARGLSPFNQKGQSIAAGRLMLQRIDDLINSRSSFAFETTGSSQTFAEKLKKAKSAGYKVGLFYVWLPDPAMAVRRVKRRITQGGHDIPEDTIERRFSRGLANLVDLYLPLADEAEIYNGAITGKSKRRIIAVKQGEDFSVHNKEIWQNMLMMAKKGDL